ncbi:hypothetical protein B1H20_14520 [Streptomyces violaceoruber]|uniref:Uncharacterized protein n=1 Tax=Streptomyces violaceoruber TaxID=1935 RepID=A0A1V0UBM7_STRVN|nr:MULTISPECIES: hypothetical protein [Streptomyces]ARF62480.1 hypothetical protein B1H20_14520 [Streptomyces violaceoruber]QLG32810.1 hypothetical protein HXS80_14775 [Streptomyces sp. CB04723]
MLHRKPVGGLVVCDPVGPDYLDDPDREVAVEAGVRLVNVLLRFGVNLEQISADKVCHSCTDVKDAYRITLGTLTVDDTHAMASQLESFALEFEQMRELLCSIPAHQAGPAEGSV